MNQTKLIQNKILQMVHDGETDKHKIYSVVVKELNVPRPTVRRASRSLVRTMEVVIHILKPDKNNGVKLE